MEEELAERFTVHRLFETADKAAFLADKGASIRGVVTGGHIGLPADIGAALPNLEIVAINGVGFDKVDLTDAKRRGFRVSNTPDVLTADVADLALGDPRRGHPVAAFGSWAAAVETRLHRDSRAAGVLTEVVVLAPVVALGVGAGRLPAPARAMATAALTWAALGGTSLGREGLAVHDLLATGGTMNACVDLVRKLGGDSVQATTMPEGTCLMRIADSVLLTC